jgi:AcrR family transcriptional regulator
LRFKKNHKLEAREKILKAAERVLRLHGIDGVGIDAVMAEAGMTSGAFYNQFSSKRELLTEVLRRGFKDLNEGFQVASQGGGLREFIDTYLSEENRKDIAGGCSVSPLLSELGRSDASTREGLQPEMKETARQLSSLFPDPAEAEKSEAWAVLALLLGGLQLSRATDDEALAKQTLEGCRRFILDRLTI